MNDEIKIYALINNMELIGTVRGEPDANGFIEVKDAMALNMQPGATPDAVKIGLMPPTFFSSSNERGVDVLLNTKSILFTYEVRSDIKQEYARLTSKILVASAGSVPNLKG